MSIDRIGEVLGMWRLDKRIGSDGMGDVYLAHRIDGEVKQRAAVKLLRTAEDEDEDGTLRSFDHPNIARWFDSGVTGDGHGYLVMEHVDGRPITEDADQRGLSIHRRVALFLEACAAIEYSHHHLVAHRDLKPGNILVNRDGVVKVVDLGVAHQLRDRDSDGPAAAFSGPYASPEQVRFGGRVGFPADIYALGAVLYELLCGHEPFDPFLAPAELETQILEDSPRAPSAAIYQSKVRWSDAGARFRLEPDMIARMRGGCRLSEVQRLIVGDLDRICLFALRKEPARRYRSVDDLRSDLGRVLEGRRPAIARSGDPMYSAPRMARRRPFEMLAAIAAISALLPAFTVLALSSDGRRAIHERRLLFDQAGQACVSELREQLRPRLTGNPRWHNALYALDTVLRTATPAPSTRTRWDNIWEYLFPLRLRPEVVPKR